MTSALAVTDVRNILQILRVPHLILPRVALILAHKFLGNVHHHIKFYNSPKNVKVTLCCQSYSQTKIQMRSAASAARRKTPTIIPIRMSVFLFDDGFSLLVKKSIRSWWLLRAWCRERKKKTQLANTKQLKLCLGCRSYLAWLRCEKVIWQVLGQFLTNQITVILPHCA